MEQEAERKIARLREAKAGAGLGGGQAGIDRQHQRRKQLPARYPKKHGNIPL